MEEDSNSPEIRRNLGHALAEKGQFQEASAQLGEAVRLSGEKDPLALYLLGCVYADLGRNQEAVALKRTALGIATQQNNAELAKAITANLSEQLRPRWLHNR
jgi:tetratricopeptide (TPR) repeat protein